ncbi:DUF2254 domain-containing protein [Roseicitreum antarcticum]|uniref:Uncharacterized membrane protein n=1 Tax=Roseicitreum antarcticum TaxID=564137 RepID=A0A1H3CHR2_9RHOB|nr:DUF2254 domain-containing protein [Roseicitreum antarcticum]SDX53691.1 Uncharacterized membrane protein [Roseicitreum antarcticum]
MISRYVWHLRETLKQVWVRVLGFALLALLAVGLARLLSPLLPETLAIQTGSGAVTQLLGILTSSMLAVTTFSLSIAVSAFAGAASEATPRATVLLQQDRTTQNVLATFLGAFVFGLVGLVALHAQLFDSTGKVVVFIFTVAVIGLVVAALIGWIGHLMQFGRMGDTLDRVEAAASDALSWRLEHPYLGGVPGFQEPACTGPPLLCTETGYIQHIDMMALQTCAKAVGLRVFVRRGPGAFVAPGVPLAHLEGAPVDDDAAAALRRAFTVGTRRTFEEDPRFGFVVMTEIATRALSPAVNDPGTAIDILGRHVRMLSLWRDRADVEAAFDRIIVPAIAPVEVVEDAFRPIARDGASLFEVQIRLQKALAALRQTAPGIFAAPCASMAAEALHRAEAAGLLPEELRLIRGAAQLQAGEAAGGSAHSSSRDTAPTGI